MSKPNLPRIWIVRPGRDSGRIKNRSTEKSFRDDSVIALDDPYRIGDVSNVKARKDVREELLRIAPDMHPSAAATIGSNYWRFAHVMTNDDLVVSPSRIDRVYMFGIVAGPYAFDEKAGVPHVRKVRWLGDVPKDDLTMESNREPHAARLFFECTKNCDDLLEQVRLLRDEENVLK